MYKLADAIAHVIASIILGALYSCMLICMMALIACILNPYDILETPNISDIDKNITVVLTVIGFIYGFVDCYKED